MIPLTLARRTRLHRVPATAKLLGLAVLAIVCAVVATTPVRAAIALAATVVTYLVGGIGVAEWARQLWRVKWLVVLLVATQAIFLGWEAAVTGTVRIVGVLILAAAVTLTTPMGEMLDAIEKILAPLRWFHLDPARAAFTIALAIAAIPVIGSLAATIREARRARGVRLGARWVVTLLVNALRHADDLGDALHAKGIAS